MSHRIVAVILTVFLSLFAFPASADTVVGGHGVVYFAYDRGSYSSEIPTSDSNNWYIPARQFKTPISLYNLNPTLVDSQLANMRASGMDYVVLQFNLAELAPCIASGACNSGFPDDWTWGYLIDSSLGKPHPTHMDNLRAMLVKIRDLGFRNVIFRFNDGRASGWATWNETEYSHAWNYIVNVHVTADELLRDSATGAIYDLGGEAPGTPCNADVPNCPATAYLQRLWSDYTFVFGSDDTVGFSAIAVPGRVQAQFAVYGNHPPSRHAYTAYGNVYTGLQDIYNNMPISERSKPVMLIETYQNDPLTALQISDFLAAHPDFHLFAVTEWPATRDPICTGCDGNVRDSSLAALNTTTQLSLMERIVAHFSQESDHPNLMSFSDVNCAATTNPTCTVQGNLTFAPIDTRLAYQVYVTTPGQPRKLWTCMSATNPVLASWITRNLEYQFDYYRTSACSTDVSGQKPDATTRLFVR